MKILKKNKLKKQKISLKTYYKNQKNSVLCLDDKTGTTAWRSERFDKRITDFILDDNKTVFVGDGDEFYSYDIASGKQLFDVKHNDAHVGKAADVIDTVDDIFAVSLIS